MTHDDAKMARRLAKARSRGYVTVRMEDDDALISAWVEACKSSGCPLIILQTNTVDRRVAFVIVQGADEQTVHNLRAIVARLTDHPEDARFPVEREMDGTFTFGPFTLQRAEALARQFATALLPPETREMAGDF